LGEEEVGHVRLLGQGPDRPQVLTFDGGLTRRHVPNAQGVGIEVLLVGSHAGQLDLADAQHSPGRRSHRLQHQC
jgi:hypothetical protein